MQRDTVLSLLFRNFKTLIIVLYHTDSAIPYSSYNKLSMLFNIFAHLASQISLILRQILDEISATIAKKKNN